VNTTFTQVDETLDYANTKLVVMFSKNM